MLLRFVVKRQHWSSRSDSGIFVAAQDLLESGDLEPHQRKLLNEHLDWFNENLRVPSRLQYPDQNRVICWFRSSAHEAIDRAREIMEVLRDAGEPVECIKSNDPGIVLEEDEHQVLAQPYRQNRKTPR